MSVQPGVSNFLRLGVWIFRAQPNEFDMAIEIVDGMLDMLYSDFVT